MGQRILEFLRTRRGIALAAVGVAAVVIGGLVALTVGAPPVSPTAESSASPKATSSLMPSPTEEPTPMASPTPSPSAAPTARCPLDGMPVADDTELVYPALAVQIENHPEARPARNLTNADIIIEGTVEGDTTRFTGIYLCDETEGMTGPVRSARYYNVDLWRDLHVLTVGFGASLGALDRFAQAGMPYPNGMDGIWPWYQRYGPRAAPHNLYVDLEAVRDALTTDARLEALAADVDELRPPWTFDEEPALPEDGRAVARIDMATNSFWRFGFVWDAEQEVYLRTDAGVFIEDEATGEAVAPTSVVVQWVTQETVFGDPDPGGNPRRLQHLVGSGEGVLYTMGRAYPVTWERPTASDRTTWSFADTGETVELPPGQVWWVILPIGSSLSES